MYLSLSPSGPIKWNHNQESSIVQDVSPFSPAYDGRSTTTLSERTRELYLQFLWLPEVRSFSLWLAFPTVFLSFLFSATLQKVHHAVEPIRSYGATAGKAFCHYFPG